MTAPIDSETPPTGTSERRAFGCSERGEATDRKKPSGIKIGGRTRVRSPQTNGEVERFFGTLKYEHLYRAVIGDGNALAVEINCFRHTYNTLRPHQALNDWTPRQVYLTSRESQ
jgi:hypothetical protein